MPDNLMVGQHADLKELLDIEGKSNVFRERGDYWVVHFGGELVLLKDCKGLRYIAHLLRNPRKVFDIMELVSAVEGRTPDNLGKAYEEMSNEQLGEYGLTKLEALGDAGDMLDQKAIMEYETEVKRLKQELQEALDEGDKTSVEKIRRDKALIEQQLRAGKGLGLRIRKATDDAERARQSVSKSVNRILRRISDNHPSLSRHLSQSIKMGRNCSYEPENEIHWTT